MISVWKYLMTTYYNVRVTPFLFAGAMYVKALTSQLLGTSYPSQPFYISRIGWRKIHFYKIDSHSWQKRQCCKEIMIEGDAKKSRRLLKNEFRSVVIYILLTRSIYFALITSFYHFRRLSSPFLLAELIFTLRFWNMLTYTRVQKSTYSWFLVFGFPT